MRPLRLHHRNVGSYEGPELQRLLNLVERMTRGDRTSARPRSWPATPDTRPTSHRCAPRGPMPAARTPWSTSRPRAGSGQHTGLPISTPGAGWTSRAFPAPPSCAAAHSPRGLHPRGSSPAPDAVAPGARTAVPPLAPQLPAPEPELGAPRGRGGGRCAACARAVCGPHREPDPARAVGAAPPRAAKRPPRHRLHLRVPWPRRRDLATARPGCVAALNQQRPSYLGLQCLPDCGGDGMVDGSMGSAG